MDHINPIIYIWLCGGGISDKQQEEYKQIIQERQKKCKEMPTYVDYAKCVNSIRTYIGNELGQQNLIMIMNVLNAYYLALAERADSGEITFNEMNAIFQELQYRLVQDSIDRLETRAYRQQELQNRVREYQPIYLKTPITCMQIGNIITCN